MKTRFPDAKILIVDDRKANVDLLEGILTKMGYGRIQSTNDPRQVLRLYTEFRPDLLLLDLHMPEMDGLTLLRQLQPEMAQEIYLPVLILTADVTAESKRRALSEGAKDFLTKPLDAVEVLLRIENLLETRTLYQALRDQNRILEEKVRQRTWELEEAQLDTLQRLALAAEYRDDETGQHTQRVGAIAALLGEALGLPAAKVALIRQAAPLHDVGKIGIPDQILLKPGKLTREEFQVIQTHTTIGGQILAESRSPLLQLAEGIALSHHERWDGRGYPWGRKEEEIPLPSRLVSLADTWDAMIHDRPYRKARPLDEAIGELERERGRQFEPRIVDAFLELARGEDSRIPRMGQPAPESG